MSEERMQELIDFLSSDPERMEKLTAMGVEEAQQAINAEGYDFTVDELREFVEAVVTVSKSNSGELSEDALDNVSGGALNAQQRYVLYGGLSTLCTMGGTACLIAAAIW